MKNIQVVLKLNSLNEYVMSKFLGLWTLRILTFIDIFDISKTLQQIVSDSESDLIGEKKWDPNMDKG